MRKAEVLATRAIKNYVLESLIRHVIFRNEIFIFFDCVLTRCLSHR